MSVTLGSFDFNGFAATGFAPNPAAGQLDSDFWRISGWSDGLLDYGGTATAGDLARGALTTDPTAGGIYAGSFAPDDNALVAQPTGGEFNPGTITLRLQHAGSAPLTSLTFDYDSVIRNNAPRSQIVTFDYAVQATPGEPTSFTAIGELGFATPLAADTLGLVRGDLAATVAVTVNPGDYVFARWTVVDNGGSGSRDELGLDNILITGTAGTPAAAIGIAPATLSLPEGNAGTAAFAFTVTRSDVAPGEGSVQVAFAPGAGLTPDEIASITVGGVAVAPEDFGAFAVAFEAAATSVAVVVTVNADTLAEPDETFTLTLSAPSTGYTLGNTVASGTVANDDVALTAISTIQGSGRSSAFAGNGLTYTIEGVVTGDFQNGDADAGRNLQGFFVQMLTGDGDAATSDGIFVFQNDGAAAPGTDVQVGDIVRITGTVTEFARFTNQRTAQLTETQLVVANSTTGIQLVTDNAFTAEQVAAQFAVDVDLPATGTVTLATGALISDLEAYEGMLARFPETLTISEMFNLDRFNEFRAIEGGQAFQFTQDNLPDVAGNAAHLADVARRTITVDDGLRVQNAPPTVFGTAIDTASAPQMGDTFQGLVGNVRFSDGSSGSTADNLSNSTSNSTQAFRILPQNAPNIEDTQPREAAPGRDGGDVKVATANLLNFFTTLNAGGATTGPGGTFEPRGANTQAEFDRQKEKLFTALAELDADVLVLNEIENDGFGAGSTIETLVTEFNQAIGAPGRWTFVDPGTPFLGGDAISVGILYRSDRIELAAGSSVEVLDDSDLPALVGAGLLPTDFLGQSTVGGVFDGVNTSRAILVATLAEIESGEGFTLAAVHNKSKSGIGTGLDSDAGDGAGNWNNQRLLANQALDAFLKTNPTGVEDPDLLLMGDFNSYAQEVSIRHLTETAGFRNLVADVIGPEAFSFIFDGQKGYLDYAFASQSLAGFVRGVHEWNVNAPEADALDYNLDFGRPAGIFDGTTPWRYSDHDPLVVNLLLAPVAALERGGNTVAVADSLQELADAALPGDVLRLREAVPVGTLVEIGVDGLIIDVGPRDGIGFFMTEGAGSAPPVSISFRGSGNLLIQGNSAGNVITDASGNSWITGEEGDDTIEGRQGDDLIFGNEGDDRLRGGLGNDTLSGGLDQDQIFGDRGDDGLSGNEGDDRLAGGEGDDLITGGAGDDLVNGGAGADTMLGGDAPSDNDGNDTLSYASSTAGVSVSLATGAASGGDAEGDVFFGFDNLIGGRGDDTLSGDAAANRLVGGLGDDVVAGGGGDDLLRGDGGNDAFVFSATDPGGRVVVADFDADGDDLVELQGFAGLDDFADIAGSLRQVGSNVALQVDADTRIIFRDTLVSQFDASDFLFG